MTSHNTDTFPSYLLTKSNAERLDYFRGLTIRHELLLNAYEELLYAIQDSLPGSIIFIHGPTGVGKTTLLKRLEKYFKDIALPELTGDLERIPIVKVQLAAPTSGSFDWKDYLKRLLHELEEPLVDDKLDTSRWDTRHSTNLNWEESDIRLISKERPGVRAMRFASERTLKRRRPVAVLIDDAQHFGILSSGRKLLDQLNTIKSLADKSEVTHVLCGTYELIPLRNLNGQLSRRSIDINFGRYKANDETHQEEFINVLNTFQQHLPLAAQPDLVSRWDYFYERTLGCIGILKDWLARSLALVLRDDCQTMSFEYLERRALSVPQCTVILSEAKSGEKELEENAEELRNLRADLGLETKSVTSNEESPAPSNLEHQPVAKPVSRKRRVGARKPVRDKTGR